MCLTALALVVLTSLALHAQSGIPNVSFDHAQVFDRRCAQLLHDTIPAAAFKELDELMVSLHARWAREGPKLLSGVVQITGRKFEFPESRFAATLCTFGSVSFPPIIDMRPFIKSTAKGDVESEAVFETVIMHEVLHHYVDDRLDPWPGGISPLLTKYKDESATVRNHLHLFAIETLLYSRLNMDSYLAESIVSENKLGPAPAFQRARAIVDRETPRAFVKELTRPPRPPVPRRPPPVPGP
jgi:hypothetical protein